MDKWILMETVWMPECSLCFARRGPNRTFVTQPTYHPAQWTWRVDLIPSQQLVMCKPTELSRYTLHVHVHCPSRVLVGEPFSLETLVPSGRSLMATSAACMATGRALRSDDVSTEELSALWTSFGCFHRGFHARSRTSVINSSVSQASVELRPPISIGSMKSI